MSQNACLKLESSQSLIGARRRYRVFITGAVQGVGFRPFVYRLAKELGLFGWVNNSAYGVTVELEGSPGQFQNFVERMKRDLPVRSSIYSMEHSELDPLGYENFVIRESDLLGPKSALILPDLSTCKDCLREIFDPSNWRYRYPFTNCVNCGPRFTIIESLPYDRRNTSMKSFLMCELCRSEYDDPLDRRFHAQPNACPDCGPHLEYWDAQGRKLAIREQALHIVKEEVQLGKIVAVKGLGGFHLIVDARNEEAVKRLRKKKGREEKPFALMFPSLQQVKKHCAVSAAEELLLNSPESPIVLLRRRQLPLLYKEGYGEVGAIADRYSSTPPRLPLQRGGMRRDIAFSVAPGNPYLGVMLPYAPLYHLLTRDLNFPVVATSGNLKDEPICIDENEALVRLAGLADCFLVHDRPIVRPVDDSVVRIMAGRPLVLRRARGYAPLPVQLEQKIPSVLAVGAHQKNTISVSVEKNVFVSQHIGDLETVQAYESFQKTISAFKQLYEPEVARVICDDHPDYLSTRYARQKPGSNPISVQHHYAHILSCMADNALEGGLLGVAWDGTGYGPDGMVWGGEFLRITKSSYVRAAHFRTFRLPGGERAVQEPRRTALGLLYAIFGEQVFEMNDLPAVGSFTKSELKVLRAILNQDGHSPFTSSAGRLFDAVASIVGIRQISTFEGQAAMELEFIQNGHKTKKSYSVLIRNNQPADHSAPVLVVDWKPMIEEIVMDWYDRVPTEKISAKFHRAMAEVIVSVSERAGEEKVALSGGCFQNKVLCETAVERLRENGFKPYWHQRIPPNDGGISLGQVVAAARMV